MEPTILTKSGKYFNFLYPEKSEFNIDDIAHALSNICRFTGHTKFHYSVASHSIMVSKLVPKKFALMGLLHDASEAFLGDVASPLKMLLPDYKLIEARVEKAVLNRFGLPDKLDPEIKKADLIALAIEKRDLMPSEKVVWDLIKHVDTTPYSTYDCLTGKSPESVYHEFLDRFDILTHEQEILNDATMSAKPIYYGI